MLLFTLKSIHELFSDCGLLSGGERWSPRVRTCEWAPWACQPLWNTCPLTSTSPPVTQVSLFALSPCTLWKERKRRAVPHPVSSLHPNPGGTPAPSSASPLKMWTSVPPGVKAMTQRSVTVRFCGCLIQASPSQILLHKMLRLFFFCRYILADEIGLNGLNWTVAIVSCKSKHT